MRRVYLWLLDSFHCLGRWGWGRMSDHETEAIVGTEPAGSEILGLSQFVWKIMITTQRNWLESNGLIHQSIAAALTYWECLHLICSTLRNSGAQKPSKANRNEALRWLKLRDPDTSSWPFTAATTNSCTLSCENGGKSSLVGTDLINGIEDGIWLSWNHEKLCCLIQGVYLDLTKIDP